MTYMKYRHRKKEASKSLLFCIRFEYDNIWIWYNMRMGKHEGVGGIMDILLRKKINIFLEEAEKIYKINFAYLFGSYAKGEQNSNSDIDIAIMPKIIDGDKMSETFIRGNLIEIAKPIFNKDVDIVFINIDSVFIKYKIVHEGVVIKDSEDRASFESLALREYFDFKYYSDYYNEKMLKSKKDRRV